MNHCCGNCQWWQGHEIPDCQEAACMARAPQLVPNENAYLLDQQNGSSCPVPISYMTDWPRTKRDQPACGAHVFVGSMEFQVVMNPKPLPEGAAEQVAEAIHDDKMKRTMEAFDREWKEAHGMLPAQDICRLVKHAIERFVGDR